MLVPAKGIPRPQNWDNRRHHKVAVALLGRFAEDGSDEGVLQVLDLSTALWRTSTPRAECAERGYYSIDADGMEPGAVEDFLCAEIEGPVGPILKSLATSQGQPTGPETGALVRFLAMQFLRTEPFRKAVIDHDRRMAERVHEEWSTDAAFDAYEREKGVSFSPGKRAAMRKMTFGQVGNSRVVHVMLDTFGRLLEDLARMRWRVRTLPIGAPNLICSDAPAQFVRVREDNGRLQPIMGGWALPAVGAMMPLSPRQLLLGAAEFIAPLFDEKVDRGLVREFNRVIAVGGRWVYAREQSSEGIVLACPVPWASEDRKPLGER